MPNLTTPFRHFTRRTWPSMSDRNRLRQTVERLASVVQSPGMAVERMAGIGVTSSPQADTPLLIEITGGPVSTAYQSWTEVLDNGDGTYSVPADALTGSVDMQAFEVADRVVTAGIYPATYSGTEPPSVLFDVGYTDEQAQDAIGGAATDTDTIDAVYDDAGNVLKWNARLQDSLTSDVNGIKLLGDVNAPGLSYAYSTDPVTGVKGWNPVVTGSGGTFTGPVTFNFPVTINAPLIVNYLREDPSYNTVSGTIHDVDPTIYGTMVLECTADTIITGFANGFRGRKLTIIVSENSVGKLTLSHANVGSSAVNRMILPNLADVTYTKGNSVVLEWEDVSPLGRWRSCDDALPGDNPAPGPFQAYRTGAGGGKGWQDAFPSILDDVSTQTNNASLYFPTADGFVVSTTSTNHGEVHLVDATGGQRGIVGTVAQTWQGEKTFNDGISTLNGIAFKDVSGNNQGSVFGQDAGTAGASNQLRLTAKNNAGSIIAQAFLDPTGLTLLDGQVYKVQIGVTTFTGATGTTAAGDTVKAGLITAAATSLPGPYAPATFSAHGVLIGEGSGAIAATAAGPVNTVLHGNGASSDPSFSAVVEADITLANNTTNNVSTTKHGFVPILPNDATKFLNGVGAFTVPSGSSTTFDTLFTPGIYTFASAATTDLTTATDGLAEISGTTTITSLGGSTLTAPTLRFVRFTGALTLTHNATSLVLPGAANITTAAGDVALFRCEYVGGPGVNWRCLFYQRAAFAPVNGTLSGASSGTNTGDQTITLTGDVTGSGTGSFPTTIGAGKVTNAMLATPPFPRNYALYEEQQTQNTSGGTATSGAWRTRTINTEVADTGGDGTLSSNQITLAAGTYECLISAPSCGTNRHQIRLQNVTDGTTILTGTSEFATANGAVPNETRSFAAGRFTIAASKALEIQHQIQTTQATFGFGLEANMTTEVFTRAEFRRIA